MKLEIETEHVKQGRIGLQPTTILRLKKIAVDGLYTGLWVNHDDQVLEHRGAMISVAGLHQGGPMTLYTMRPERRS